LPSYNFQKVKLVIKKAKQRFSDKHFCKQLFNIEKSNKNFKNNLLECIIPCMKIGNYLNMKVTGGSARFVFVGIFLNYSNGMEKKY
jgi:hypothetical protein